MLTSLLTIALLGAAPPPTADGVEALLRAKDQALLDAVALGGRGEWDQALAADALIVDENGEVLERAEFLKQLEPLPAGISGTIRIASFTARVTGDLAAVVHVDDEAEDYHGQKLRTRYLVTETWRREAADWKLHLIHFFAVPKDPPPVALPDEALRQYAGVYAAGPDLRYLIRWDGSRLLGGRPGASPRTLQVEVRDVLFVPGQPRSRKVFTRRPDGAIAGFVDRREGEDLRWTLESTVVP